MKKGSFLLALIMIFLFSSAPVSAAVQKKERKWQDETIYYVMIDRFNDGDTKNDFKVNTLDPLAWHGGDFQGIIEKLAYIKDMGFTTISLTPIFENGGNGYDGYSVQNYYKTEAHFGSLATFQKLVNEAHKRHLKVIIDFPANQVSRQHPWVHNVHKQNWLKNQNQTSGLADLNLENPAVKKYLIDAAKWWIKNTDIDGYRLNSADSIPVPFLSDFSKEVKKEKQGFFLLGDLSTNDPEVLKQYQQTGIDSFTNHSLNARLLQGFAGTDQLLTNLVSDQQQYKQQNSNPYLMATFMDDPWSTRFTEDIVQKRQFPGSRWQMALTYLYTTPGIPVVYYGSEIALNGGTMPDNRRQMDFRTDKELIDYLTKLGTLRQQLPSLTRGNIKLLYEKNGMIVFKRAYKAETSVVAINNTSQSQSVTLTDSQLDGGKELRGLLNGDVVKSKDRQYKLILDRDKAEIYVLTNQSGFNLPLIAALSGVYLLFMGFIFLLIKRRKNQQT